MKKVHLKNIVYKEEKYYVSQCLNVDVSSFGSTIKEALANLNEALKLYFEDSQKKTNPKVERPEIVSSIVTYTYIILFQKDCEKVLQKKGFVYIA